MDATLFDVEEPDAPAPPTVQLSRAQANMVLRWQEQGIAVLRRWQLMYAGLDDAPISARALLDAARTTAGVNSPILGD